MLSQLAMRNITIEHTVIKTEPANHKYDLLKWTINISVRKCVVRRWQPENAQILHQRWLFGDEVRCLFRTNHVIFLVLVVHQEYCLRLRTSDQRIKLCAVSRRPLPFPNSASQPLNKCEWRSFLCSNVYARLNLTIHGRQNRQPARKNSRQGAVHGWFWIVLERAEPGQAGSRKSSDRNSAQALHQKT